MGEADRLAFDANRDHLIGPLTHLQSNRILAQMLIVSGIELEPFSNNNTLNGNNVINNSEFGIELESSENNMLSSNNVMNNNKCLGLSSIVTSDIFGPSGISNLDVFFWFEVCFHRPCSCSSVF